MGTIESVQAAAAALRGVSESFEVWDSGFRVLSSLQGLAEVDSKVIRGVLL